MRCDAMRWGTLGYEEGFVSGIVLADRRKNYHAESIYVVVIVGGGAGASTYLSIFFLSTGCIRGREI